MRRAEEIKVVAEVGSPALVSLFVHMPSMHHEVASSSLPTAAPPISRRGGDFKGEWEKEKKGREGRNGPKWSCQSASQNAAGSSSDAISSCRVGRRLRRMREVFFFLPLTPHSPPPRGKAREVEPIVKLAPGLLLA